MLFFFPQNSRLSAKDDHFSNTNHSTVRYDQQCYCEYCICICIYLCAFHNRGGQTLSTIPQNIQPQSNCFPICKLYFIVHSLVMYYTAGHACSLSANTSSSTAENRTVSIIAYPTFIFPAFCLFFSGSTPVFRLQTPLRTPLSMQRPGLFVCLLVCWFVGLFVCLFVCWFVGLFVCLLVCWFVGLFVVCLFFVVCVCLHTYM